jgi:hypothetical protein
MMSLNPLTTNVILLDVIQDEGDTIFVPSGWYHQVHNIGDVISLNHNWCNAYNIAGMWSHIQEQRRDVIRALNGYNFDAVPPVVEQLKPRVDIMLAAPPPITDDEIETVLRAECGIDLVAFWRFLVWNAHRLCTMIVNDTGATATPTPTPPSTSVSSSSTSGAMSDTVRRTTQQGLRSIATILDELAVHDVLKNALIISSPNHKDNNNNEAKDGTSSSPKQCPLTLLVASTFIPATASSPTSTAPTLRPSEWPVMSQSLTSLHRFIDHHSLRPS